MGESKHIYKDQDAPLLKTNPASTAVRIRTVNTAWIRHKHAWGLPNAVTNLGSFPPWLPLKEDHQSKTHDWGGNPEMKVAMVRPHVQDKRQLATIAFSGGSCPPSKEHSDQHQKEQGLNMLKTTWAISDSTLTLDHQASTVWTQQHPWHEIILIQTLARGRKKKDNYTHTYTRTLFLCVHNLRSIPCTAKPQLFSQQCHSEGWFKETQRQHDTLRHLSSSPELL